MNWWNELTELQKLFASIAIPATVFMVFQFILLLFGFAHGGDADATHGVDMSDGGGTDMADAAGFAHSPDLAGTADVHGDLNMSHDSGHDIFSGHSHDTLHEGHDTTDHHTGEGHDNADALRLFTLRGIVAFLSVGGWMGVTAIDWKLSSFVSVVLAFAAGGLALYFVAWTIRAFVRMQHSGNINLKNAAGRDGDVYLTIPENGRGKVNVIVQDRLCEIDAVTKAGRAIKTGEKITVLGVASEGVLLVAPKNSPESKSSPEPLSLLGP